MNPPAPAASPQARLPWPEAPEPPAAGPPAPRPLRVAAAARRRPDPTPPLIPGGLDKPLRKMAQTRNLAGEFFEAASAALFGADRIGTDSRCDYCPDLVVPGAAGVYLENKSVGRNGGAIVYEHRHAKDRRFVDAGHPLAYCFWHHRARALDARFDVELHAMLAAATRELIVLPFGHVDRVLAGRPVRRLNTKPTTRAGDRLGYGTHGYGAGWSVRIADLRAAAGERQPVGTWPAGALVVRGVAFPAFDVSVPPVHWALMGMRPL